MGPILIIIAVCLSLQTRQNEETLQTNVVGQIRLGENL